MGYSGLTVASHVCLFPIYIKYEFLATFAFPIDWQSKAIQELPFEEFLLNNDSSQIKFNYNPVVMCITIKQ